MKKSIISQVSSSIPGIKLIAGESFSWSPAHQTITYVEDKLNEPEGVWALLHETAHAQKQHASYNTDLELLKLEVEAWDLAKNIGKKLDIQIDDEHIQNCLDTYRDWLHRRSSCPNCKIVCLQVTPTQYSCHNCLTNWTVTTSRFCRPYRLLVKSQNKKPLKESATFL